MQIKQVYFTGYVRIVAPFWFRAGYLWPKGRIPTQSSDLNLLRRQFNMFCIASHDNHNYDMKQYDFELLLG